MKWNVQIHLKYWLWRLASLLWAEHKFDYGIKDLRKADKLLMTKVFLIVFFDCIGVGYHEFLPQGHMVNKECYPDVNRRLCKALRQKHTELWENQSWISHYDYSPAHTSMLVREFLAKNKTVIMPQPPYSPDLVSSDFSLFPVPKSTPNNRFFWETFHFNFIYPQSLVARWKHFSSKENDFG